MDFTTEQAKSIFDLIKTVSPYAYPLLLSLIFPILWVALKKLLGISNNAPVQTQSKKLFGRIFSNIRSFITLSGDFTDKTIFYFCIVLFLIGGIFLKVGEHAEEVIRQNALSLKSFYETQNYLFISSKRLNQRGFSDKILKDIQYNYPNDFVANEDSIITCTDTAVVNKIISTVYPLLESYLTVRLKVDRKIEMDDLFQLDTIFNVKNYFSYDIVYGFLSQPCNKGKYNIDVINNRTNIIKGDSLE